MKLLHAQISLENNKPPRLEIYVEGPITGNINVHLFINKALFFRVVTEDGRVAGGFMPLYEGTILWMLRAADVGHVVVEIRRRYNGGVEAFEFVAPVEEGFKKAVRAILATRYAS